ncbi:MAG: hypothetical protein A2046_04240 [Bacteroidetes bacterium GWA2_30_7]|nr:MAG: hypothetical protein A2046_04240 [Bacteroidetes bacterium GWA2_30_7]
MQKLINYDIKLERNKRTFLAQYSQAFTSEANRMVFLFELYDKYTADLFTKEKVKKSKRKFILE